MKLSSLWIGWIAAFVLLLAGCSKEEVDDPNKPFTLAGSDTVLKALQAKDYEALVTGLGELRTKVTEKDMAEYRRLRTKVTDQLVNEMGDSEPARDAYRAIGMMETGR
ncbi:MAG: hypothetical protein J0M24_09595 [Verrucomicrobia bacterium]|nr:hypothetical protein [Verrucomicrobiota bacterium]